MIDRRAAEVVLRDVKEADLDVFFGHQRQGDGNALAGFPPRDRAAFTAHWAKILADPSVVTKAIVVQDQVVGNIVSFAQDGEREVGYWIDQRSWGRGIATAALRAFLRQVPRRPLYAHVARHNAPSIRVLEKCGFAVTPPASDQARNDDEIILVLHA